MRLGALAMLLAAAGLAAVWLARPMRQNAAGSAGPPARSEQSSDAPEATRAPLVPRQLPATVPASPAAGPYVPPMRYDPVAAAAFHQQVYVVGLEPDEIAKLQAQPAQAALRDPERDVVRVRRHLEVKEWKRQHPEGGIRP